MPKILLFALLFSLGSLGYARTESEANAANIISRAGRSKGKPFDRVALTRAIDQTLVIVEDLSRQLKLASKEEIADVWASGERDFKLDGSEVSNGRKACESMLKALEHEAKASERDAERAKSYRSDARDHVRSHHKKKSEEYVQGLRNWLSISEGSLRKAIESRDSKK